MTFSDALVIFFALLYLRSLRVNDKLRKQDPWERQWRQFEKRQLKHRGPRVVP